MTALPRLRRAGSKRVNPEGRMTLVDHVYELRNRLFKSLVALAIGTVIGYIWYEHGLFDFLRKPYCDLPDSIRQSESCDLPFFGVLDGFFLRLRIAMIAGVVISSPVWLYQLWGFITPGLHRNEKRWAVSFVSIATLLFLAGAAVAYITLQKGLQLLLGIAGDGVIPVIEVTRYLRYVVAMLLVFGVSFEFPLIITMLNLAGLVSAEKLRSIRRAVIFGVFAFAAIATPSQDPFTMVAMALPMCLLYEGAVVVARIHDKRAARRELESGYGRLDDDEASPLDERPSPLDEDYDTRRDLSEID